MRRRIDALIVEDEPIVREAAHRILLAENLTVAAATDVDEAMAVLKDTQCRIVLSDLMLPGASGFDLLESIRKRWPATEVVLMTGYATIESALKTFQKGAFDFVAKPFDIGELLCVVRRALRFSTRNHGRQAISLDPPPIESGDETQDRCFFLGRHSWARLHADGSATLGVGETFPHLLGKIERVDLPAPHERYLQGKLFTRIFTQEDVICRVWSPLSGTVLTVNERLLKSTALIDQDPFGEGWLIRIIPHNLGRELEILDRRRFQME